MNRGLSIYLDLLRLVAALEVFAFHLAGLPQTGVARAWWNAAGHEAVTIFFVLSGFVIRHAAGTRDRNLEVFAVSRLTRVYSVAVPALILTLLFDVVGRSLEPAIYQGLSPEGSPWLRLALGSAMLNEAWVSVQMLSNTPYWSISYEWWYYALFAAAFFLKGPLRIALILLSAAIAGPKILLLFPIWVFGWIAYTERVSERLPRVLHWLLFLQPLAVGALYFHFDWENVGRDLLLKVLSYDVWRSGLSWSRFVLSDTVLGLSIALHLIGAKRVGPALEAPLTPVERPVRWAAGRSFTLYLLHQPAILVVTATVSLYAGGLARGLVVAAASLGVVLLVATFTENQRYRLKIVFQRLLGWSVISAGRTAQRVRLMRKARAEGRW